MVRGGIFQDEAKRNPAFVPVLIFDIVNGFFQIDAVGCRAALAVRTSDMKAEILYNLHVPMEALWFWLQCFCW